MVAGDAEARLTAILEQCNESVAQLGVASQEAIPEGYRGALGHFPVYFPEEIVHGARLLPVNLLGGGNRIEVRLADARLGSFICSICRNTTELGLSGKLAGLTGFVTHPICDAAKHLAGIWGRNFPDQLSEILYLPQNVNTRGAVQYLYDEYQRLRGDIERRIGESISDEAIRASIRTYNENRRLLREIYQIRCETPWKLSSAESYLLLRARTRIPCERHNTLLREAVEAIRQRDLPAQDKPRVVFVGGFCEQPRDARGHPGHLLRRR